MLFRLDLLHKNHAVADLGDDNDLWNLQLSRYDR